MPPRNPEAPRDLEAVKRAPSDARPACPACGGRLVEIKAKLQCERCRTICETCCEGGPG